MSGVVKKFSKTKNYEIGTKTKNSFPPEIKFYGRPMFHSGQDFGGMSVQNFWKRNPFGLPRNSPFCIVEIDPSTGAREYFSEGVFALPTELGDSVSNNLPYRFQPAENRETIDFLKKELEYSRSVVAVKENQISDLQYQVSNLQQQVQDLTMQIQMSEHNQQITQEYARMIPKDEKADVLSDLLTQAIPHAVGPLTNWLVGFFSKSPAPPIHPNTDNLHDSVQQSSVPKPTYKVAEFA